MGASKELFTNIRDQQSWRFSMPELKLFSLTPNGCSAAKIYLKKYRGYTQKQLDGMTGYNIVQIANK